MSILARRRGARSARAVAWLVIAGIVIGCGSTPTSPPASPAGSPVVAASPSPEPAACLSLDPGPVQLLWGDRVFYEIFVRSFADSDGDGIGDLAGLTARLDYLNDGNPATAEDLGVTGIWLMPVAEAASYHGYDVVDYTAVESDYGTEADFRGFVEAAHARGIKVIVDFVPNHSSRDHPWFQDALAGGDHRDWYRWSDEDPGWPAVAGPNPWHEAPDGTFYYGAFWEGMPDLDLSNPDVTAELERAAATWLDRGVDGFRIDAAKHLIEDDAQAQVNTQATKDWLAAFRDAVHAIEPDALVLGEVWDARAISSAYVAEGSLDMAFDFPVGPAILSGVYNNASTLLASQEEVASRYASGLAGTFLSNHDQPRAMTQLRGDLGAAKQAAETLLTSPGVPFVYYGEELGLAGAKPDERIRTPFPWTDDGPGLGFTTGAPWQAFADGASEISVEVQTEAPDSLLNVYRDLVRLRTTHPALAIGAFDRVRASSRSVAASVRSIGQARLLVLQNVSSDPIPMPSLALEDGLLCGTPKAQVLYPEGVDVEATIPTVTPSGGFVDWWPLTWPELPARATVVIDLGPAD